MLLDYSPQDKMFVNALGKAPTCFQKTETSFCLSFIFRFLQSSYYTGKVCIDTDRLFCDGIWADSFSQIDAGVNRFRVLIGHLPKRIFDDSRSIAAYAQFQKEDMQSRMAAQEILVAAGRIVPASSSTKVISVRRFIAIGAPQTGQYGTSLPGIFLFSCLSSIFLTTVSL